MSLAQSAKRLIRKSKLLNTLATQAYLAGIQPMMTRRRARSRGLDVAFSANSIDVFDSRRRVRIARAHAIYLNDVIGNFAYFHEAVHPDASGLVDYSGPRLHQVAGFDLHPVWFPSLAEPVATTEQYLDFANLSEGGVAIDLGAYSGLTSIMFRQLCGDSGRVVAVDADAGNLEAIRKNLALYEGKTGRRIDLLEGAVWTHNRGISFSCEGCMGSSATDIVGDRMGVAELVPSFTLNDIADRYGLDRVDFIKCDIEGAEAVIFADDAFFARFKPRIIVEVHPVDGGLTDRAVMDVLGRYGYRFAMVQQAGDSFPLLECRAD